MSTGTDDRTTVFIDADNTLWDTDSVFAAAQLRLLGDVEAELGRINVAQPLAYVREIDQAIAECHHDGLRYPPRLLVRALEKALSGCSPDAAARAANRGRHDYGIDESTANTILRAFAVGLAAIPALRQGVRAGLETMRANGIRLVVISESPKARVEATAAQHDILHHFDRIVEGAKNAELYARMLLVDRTGRHAFMVGDQIDRDILPAQAAGLKTIHFPSGFQPRWTLSSRDVAPDHSVVDFSEVAEIVRKRRGRPSTRLPRDPGSPTAARSRRNFGKPECQAGMSRRIHVGLDKWACGVATLRCVQRHSGPGGRYGDDVS